MAVANNGMVQWDAYLAALDLRDEESFEACIAACQRNLENPDITPFLRMKNLLAWATAEEYWHKTQALLRDVERLWRERQQSATTGQDFAEQSIIRRGLDELLQRQREELEEDEFEREADEFEFEEDEFEQEEDEFEEEEDEFEAEDDEFEAEEDESEGDEMETEELDKIEAKEDEEFSREIDPYEHDIREGGEEGEQGEQGEQGESGTVEKTGMSEDDENR